MATCAGRTAFESTRETKTKYYIFLIYIGYCPTPVRQKRYKGRHEETAAAGRFTTEPDTEKITIRIPQRHLRALDFLVEIDDFPSRSEAIRAGIRDLIYARLELVVDRMKKFEHAEQSLAAIKTYEEKYLKK
jgi:Arc/MetJ-type ribon-helix-helix transcriptional regulator